MVAQHKIIAAAILRFIILGPLTGSLIGIVQTLAALMVWLLNGQPDEFYFRGWSGVQVHCVLFMIAGGVAGIPYGGILLVLEKLKRRTVKLIPYISLLCLLAFLLKLGVAEWEFSRGRLSPFFAAESASILLGLLLWHPFSSKKTEDT